MFILCNIYWNTELKGIHMKHVLIATMALLLSVQAQAYLLDNWNVNELDASGDYVEINVSHDAGNTFLAISWFENDTSDSSPTAIGIDTVFYNCDLCSFSPRPGDDTGSFGGLLDSNLGSWSGNFGGVTGGGGFGDFSSRHNADGGGTDGITNTIVLELLGDVSFSANSLGSIFDVHVRYDNGCSGWASDGPNGGSDSDSNCGTTEVPEPSSIVLLLVGLIGVVTSRRLTRQ